MISGNREIGRRFFYVAGAGALLSAKSALSAQPKSVVRFGMIADIHHSLMPGAQGRLESFLDAANRHGPDFLIQIGDFCHGFSSHPSADQQEFLRTWQHVKAPTHNVLGNHEMDHCDKATIMDLLQMKRSFYSFDCNQFHFVVLDCMHIKEDGRTIDYVNGNYFHHSPDQINWITDEQLEWFAADVRATTFPTVIFTHPCINAFWAKGAEGTRTNVREAIEKANADSERTKIIACFSGHHHADHHSERSNVHYFLVNSASYYWVGDAYGKLAKYRDPLYTFVTITSDGSLTIAGKSSVFVPPTPTELKHPDAPYATASIEARSVRFQVKSKSSSRSF